MKVKLFNLRLLASLCNFNYLQIFVKAKFTVLKYNSKISIIYHQIKFRKGITNRSSIKKPFLKISQYSQKNTCVGVSFLNKKQAFSPETLLKRGFNSGAVNIAKFLKTPVLKNICERLFERFRTWANNTTSNIGIEEDIFSKTKQRKPF